MTDPPGRPTAMGMGYRVVRWLARGLITLFYRRVDVAGLERVPEVGPLLVTANHQNALIDPMLLIAAIPRRLRPLAKAPLFRYPLIGPLLRLTGALPVLRRQDAPGGRPPGANRDTVQRVEAALRDGQAVLIFPEGVSQPEPALQPLRGGAARMALAAHDPAAGIRVTLLPVGLLVHRPGTFRDGRAVVSIGEPVPVAGTPEDVTSRLAGALRAVTVDAGDRETLRVLRLAEVIWRAESTEPHGGAAETDWLRAALEGYRRLSLVAPDRVAVVRREIERYARELERLSLSGPQLDASYDLATATRYALREGSTLLVSAPLALAGLSIHGPPYQATRLATRLVRPAADVEATAKLAAGLVLYPVCWILEAALVARLGGRWALIAFLVALAPTGLLALAWQERLGRMRREARAFARFLLDRDLAKRLRARRRQLRADLEELARLAPAPTGPGPDGSPSGSGAGPGSGGAGGAAAG